MWGKQNNKTAPVVVMYTVKPLQLAARLGLKR